MNDPYGFTRGCTLKASADVFKEFSHVFESLPVGHIIGDAVLVVHGGLFGDDSVTIETIQGMDRFMQPPEKGPMNDILWSDPMDQDGHAPSPRGTTELFGPDITARFLRDNGLELLIRSHQVKDQGYAVEHNGKCITVFSAPNYMGKVGNMGAIAELAWDDKGGLLDVEFQQFAAQPIPADYRPMVFTSFSAYF